MYVMLFKIFHNSYGETYIILIMTHEIRNTLINGNKMIKLFAEKHEKLNNLTVCFFCLTLFYLINVAILQQRSVEYLQSAHRR